MIITIKSNSAFATIDTLGAELKSFRDAIGCEYIWSGNEEFWGKSSPILFPVIGFLKNNQTIINGEVYNIPKHGFARTKEFRVVYSTTDKVILSLSYDDETLKMYPFKFTLQVTYFITGCSLEIRYDVFNQDTKAMPFCIGAHPAFNIPLDDTATFEEYFLTFPENETAYCPKVDTEQNLLIDNERTLILNNQNKLKLDYSYFAVDALIFDKIKSRKVSFSNLLSGKGVEICFENFNMLGVWTIANKKAPFLCLEPWCGCADFDTDDGIFENKPGIQIANPSENKKFTVVINPL